MNGYRALQHFEAIAPDKAKAIKEGMTKAQTAKFEEANVSPRHE